MRSQVLSRLYIQCRLDDNIEDWPDKRFWEELKLRYDAKSTAGLDAYSDRALVRISQAERFSWWMTMLLHRFPERSGFDQKVQRAELEYLAQSPTAQASLAENYVGLPY